MPSRREFLAHGLGAVVSLSPLTRPSLRSGRFRKRLIVLFQRGGADGLHMIVPHADAASDRCRPTIAVPGPGSDGGAIDLDGFFGLHPALAPLHALYRRRLLAVVHACGLPAQARSHLEAQEAVESMLARLAGSAPRPQVTVVENRGWDCHARQGGADGQLAERLGEFARRIVALTGRGGESLGDSVIVTLSEFGRSVRENAEGGTEHGNGQAMLVIGSGLTGGRVHGTWPGREFDGPGLTATTDVRDLLGRIVAGRTDLQS